jgi:hypothetical protein
VEILGLRLETYVNRSFGGDSRPGNNAGGQSLFKALGHPLAADAAPTLLARLAAAGTVALYDPEDFAATFDAIYPLGGLSIVDVFVQNVAEVGRDKLGRKAKPITALRETKARALLILSFDGARLVSQIEPFLPKDLSIETLESLRLPAEMLSNPARYLDPLNFATNFAFLRDEGGRHSRIVSANYWGGYGAPNPALWLRLYDEAGRALATWTENPGKPGAAFAIDSREVRKRFGLGDFAGSLFVHAIRIKGHDVVKYALDIYGEEPKELSCSHDANAWPADLYSGMPAPGDGERLVLWVQNSYPTEIPAGAVGFNLMGRQEIAAYPRAIPPFASHAIDVGKLLPDARWPDQIEVQAGKYFVRPRYEVVSRDGRRRLAHANVERTDLKPDPGIADLAQSMGKGYILPLPVPPVGEFETTILPTPMSTAQRELPLGAALYDASGERIAERFLGRLGRHESRPLGIDAWLAEAKAKLPSGSGHVELHYDFRDGGEADGWLHGLARIRQRRSGHEAETIFGAHIYNTPLVYRDEPQSYTGRPPGLSTRLFLRVDPGARDALCHLIYPASTPWRARSTTALVLMDSDGREVAKREVAIPCGGSHHFRYHATFAAAERAQAGPGAYVLIRDTTCRLFGFHGLLEGDRSFSLDHMFGF